MLKSIRGWCARRPRLVGGLGLCGILAGVGLTAVATVWRPGVRDPSGGDPAAAAAFVTSPRFAGLSSRRRDEYLRGLSLRYVGATPDQRRAMEAGLSANGADPALVRAGGREVGLAMVRSSLDGYDRLSPEERQRRLAALRTFTRAMGFRTGAAAALDPASRPVADAAGTEDAFREGIGDFRRDVLDAFSAEQRTAMAKMAEDLRTGPVRRSTSPKQ